MHGKAIYGMALFSVIIVSIVSISNCSFLGYHIGSKIDSSKLPRNVIPGWKIETIKPGRQIDIILKNGKVVSGKYLGI